MLSLDKSIGRKIAVARTGNNTPWYCTGFDQQIQIWKKQKRNVARCLSDNADMTEPERKGKKREFCELKKKMHERIRTLMREGEWRR